MAVMERFLARTTAVLPDSALLKGGLALELRFGRARTTKDIDLRAVGAPADLQRLLDEAAAHVLDPDDHLRFTIRADPRRPKIQAAFYEGLRFDVGATLAGRPYGDPFGVDVAFADPVHGEAEELPGGDLFAFAGIGPVKVRVYPVETHLAEKLHAYTVRSGTTVASRTCRTWR